MKRSALVMVMVITIFILGCGSGGPSPTVSQPVTTQTNPAPSGSPVITPDDNGNNPDDSRAQIDQARALYPASVTSVLLSGEVAPPEGFDRYVAAQIGQERLDGFRNGVGIPTGGEHDTAALALLELGVALEDLDIVPVTGSGGETSWLPCKVTAVNAQYEAAPGNLNGWFTTGQSADIMLSGVDFNNTGGPLLFNHPKGIASDGTRLLVADGNNNRVLIWNSLPQGNTAPDIVLGQPDFTSNNPGDGLEQMNWPASVATDGQRIFVADTENTRILIWNSFPTQNGAPADIVLDGTAGSTELGEVVAKNRFGWPWGVWTDGTKLAITSTGNGGYVLIWNSIPSVNDQPADIMLDAGGDFGTPRTITSNGQCLIVGDHNAQNTSAMIGNFFWSTFPTIDDQPYDFFAPDPLDSLKAWMTGGFTADGKLIMLGSTVHVWNSFPADAADTPDVSISGFKFDGGDGASLAVAGNKVYVSVYNGNRVLVYNNIPDEPTDIPVFAVGSPDIYTNTLDEHYFITNAIPVTNGESLFVSSDFDKKLYVWQNIPGQSGAYPDYVYSLGMVPWDNALYENNLVLAGRDTVMVWQELPTAGQLPKIAFQRNLGGVELKSLQGVALDGKYFYLSDDMANKVYVWEGIPLNGEAPVITLDIQGPCRLSSDGVYLAVTILFDHAIYLYRVDGLSAGSQPVVIGGFGVFNLPQNAIVSHGSLFVADSGFNKVYIWRNVDDAYAGFEADVILGKGVKFSPSKIGRDTFFTPAGLAFDGNYLWVGEFKFSGRMVRFTIQ
jgi:hypothetical protein